MQTDPQFLPLGGLQVASAEYGFWTPAIVFSGGNGDLNVAYTPGTGQVGLFNRYGNMALLFFRIVTSTFIHTTAAGNLTIAGAPFTSIGQPPNFQTIGIEGTLIFQGITKAGYTQFNCAPVANQNVIGIQASGSGVGTANVVAADVPSGGTIVLQGSAMLRMPNA